MTGQALLLLLFTATAAAQPGLRLTSTFSGPRQLNGGSLRLRIIPQVETISFTPLLSYRIQNQGLPGWSVTLQSPAPSLGETSCPVWRYQAGSGVLTSLNGLPGQNDQALAGELTGQGLTVLSTQLQGDFLYTLGNFQVQQPAFGPAGNYTTTLTVTLTGQP